jgi:hypothetical protein
LNGESGFYRAPLFWAVLLIILVTGCSGGTPDTAEVIRNPRESPASAATQVVLPEVSATVTIQTDENTPATSLPLAETLVLPSQVPTDALPPTPRTGLEASNPATFVVASGQFQLVEFFAFW